MPGQEIDPLSPRVVLAWCLRCQRRIFWDNDMRAWRAVEAPRSDNCIGVGMKYHLPSRLKNPGRRLT